MKRQQDEPCEEEVLRQELAERYLFTINRNSLFTALALILYDDERYCESISQSVINYMQQHHQQMLGFLNSMAIETSANSMIAIIPDELLMQVVVEVLERNINVYDNLNMYLDTYIATSSNRAIQDINIWYYHNEYSAAPMAQTTFAPMFNDDFFTDVADQEEGFIVEQAVVSTDVAGPSSSSIINNTTSVLDGYFLSAFENQEDDFPYMIDLFGEQRSDSPHDISSLDF
jgi:hypothetical protein